MGWILWWFKIRISGFNGGARMIKVLKWIYRLGYEAGHRDCEESFRLEAQSKAAFAQIVQDWDDNQKT